MENNLPEKKELSVTDSLIGYTLGEALKQIQEEGYKVIDISITAPPKMNITEYDDSFRVLRVNQNDDKSLTLLICKPL